MVGGYGFAYAAGLVTGGRLGDLYGHRTLFVLGMVAFTAASLLCGLATGPWQLVAFRVLQGATAALMVPQMLALINTLFPPAERATAMAAFGATVGLGAVAGQVLGGILLELDLFGWGWRTIFFINVPVGLVAAALAARWLPGHRRTANPRLDPVGALGLAAAIALILVPITLGRPAGWPLWTWVSMAAAPLVAVLTLRYERRLTAAGGDPVFDPNLVRDRVFGAGMVISGGYLAYFAGFMLCLTLLLQDGLGLSPLQAGFTFAPLGVAFAASSFLLARRVSARIGNRVMSLGTVFSMTGLLLTVAVLEYAGGEGSAPMLVPGMLLAGIGNGLTIPTALGAVLSGIAPQQAGVAAGLLTSTQQFGNAIGATVLATVFFAALGTHTGPASYGSAMQVAALVGLGLLAVVLAATFVLPRSAR
nr:MFS transporter [Nocardia sp. AG03]